MNTSGLTYQEVEHLKTVLGDTASPVQVAIARMLISVDANQWINTRKFGALVLVVDRARECKLLRLYDLKTFKVLFDQELAVGMKYTANVPYFHQFEIEGAVVGFDFASEKAAEAFWSKIQQMIPKDLITPSNKNHVVLSDTSAARSTSWKSMFGMQDVTHAQTASVVSRPKDLKHLQHIGYDAEKGFQVENIPEEWRKLFNSAKISTQELQNVDTAKKIVQTIEKFYAEEQPAQETVVAAPEAVVTVVPAIVSGPVVPVPPIAPPVPNYNAIAAPKQAKPVVVKKPAPVMERKDDLASILQREMEKIRPYIRDEDLTVEEDAFE